MNKKSTIYEIAVCAIFAALLCILSPLSIPIGPVPLSLATLILYLAVFLLGTRGATISCIVYLLLGLVGLPVFSGYSGGVAKLAGPTGGYLIGYIFLTLISGIIMELSNLNIPATVLGMVLATVVLYAFGTTWFVIQMDCTFTYALSVCVVPFLIGDAIKIAIANVLGHLVRRALKRTGLLPNMMFRRKES